MKRERNPNYNTWKFKKPMGYKDLGHAGFMDKENAQLAKAAHIDGKIREYDNSMYLYRCTDVIQISDKYKVFWHVDMS